MKRFFTQRSHFNPTAHMANSQCQPSEDSVMKHVESITSSRRPFAGINLKAVSLLLGAVLGSGAFAPAFAWNHTTIPLFYASGAQPNVMLLVDDSGSMHHMTYSKSYSDYLAQYPTTNNQYNGNTDDASDPYDRVWRFCTSMTSGSNALTTSSQGVNRCTNTENMSSGLSIQTPVVPSSGSFPTDNGTNSESDDRGYIFGEYGSGNGRADVDDDPILCDVTYFNTASSGAGRGFKVIKAGSGVPSQNVGVMVSTVSGTSQNSATQACVRFKEASTAVSPRNVSGSSCVNTSAMSAGETPSTTPKCPSALDVVTTYESGYLMYLLTRNINVPSGAASYLVNFSNTYNVTPVTGTADTITENSTYPNGVTATITNPASHQIIPNLNRIESARQASLKVYNDNKLNLRIGLARFAGSSGSDIRGTQGAVIGTADATLQARIKTTRAEDSTPLTESLYEITRYFAGMAPQYTSTNGSSAFSSPVQYRCQKSYAVVLTDGDPTSDAHRAVCGNGSSTVPSLITNLPGWPANTMNYDGYTDACIGNEEVVLDDMAQWGFDRDLRTTSSTTAAGVCPAGVATPGTGNDCSGKSWDDPSGTDAVNTSLGKFQRQDLTAYTVAFGLKNDVLTETPELKTVQTVASSAINVGADTITISNHGLLTDDSVIYRKALVKTGAPAAGLTDQTEYFVTRVDNNTIKLSLIKGGVVADITSQGSGNHTLSYFSTPRANDHRASRLPGRFYAAMTADELSAALNDAFTEINSVGGAASSVAVNGDLLAGGLLVYAPSFETANWSGNIRALQLNTNGTIDLNPVWQARNTITLGNRGAMMTSNNANNGGVAFTYGNLGAQQQADINNDTNVVSWLLGTAVANYRTRPQGLLGDIIDSSPRYVGAPDFRYGELLDPCPANGTGTAYTGGTNCTGAKLYDAYVTANGSRTPMLYVGANDGQLHGIRASDGRELLSFIPKAVFADWDDTDEDGIRDAGEAVNKKLYDLTRPGYKHQYFVNSTPTIADAYNGSAWKTLLTSGEGAGGRSVFTLDVTDTSFVTGDVEWEFTHTNLGYTYSRPILARLADGGAGRWVVIFGNGLDSGGDRAQLFIVDAFTGALVQKLDTSDGGPVNENGIVGFQVQVDANRTVTRIYAGDMRGNIWRINTTGALGSYPAPVRIFTATDSLGNRQPITGGLRLGNNPQKPGDTMVFFGTGKYIEEGIDNTYSGTPKEEAFYGISDDGSNTVITKTNLVEQTISRQVINGVTYRNLSQNPVNYSQTGVKGWYISLVVGTTFEGEKTTGTPLLYGGRIIWVDRITTNADRCVSGGTGVLMEADALTGGQIASPILDTNGDGNIDDQDTNVAGREYDGMITDPELVTDPNSNKDYKIFATSGGGVEVLAESQPPPEGSDKGRMSWQQLQ